MDDHRRDQAFIAAQIGAPRRRVAQAGRGAPAP